MLYFLSAFFFFFFREKRLEGRVENTKKREKKACSKILPFIRRDLHDSSLRADLLLSFDYIKNEAKL